MVGWSVIARLLLMLRVSLPWPQIEQLMSGLLITGCALILFGGSCAAWVFLLLRYYRGLYGGEGYLVHTLPTSATNLLWAKLLAALLWELCVGLSLVLSLVILGAGTQVMKGFLGFFSLIWRNANELFASATLVTLIFELLVLIPLTMGSGILLAYAAISLGQRMRENRVLGAVAAYIALSFGINMVFGVVNTVVGGGQCGAFGLFAGALDGRADRRTGCTDCGAVCGVFPLLPLVAFQKIGTGIKNKRKEPWKFQFRTALFSLSLGAVRQGASQIALELFDIPLH